MKCHQPFMTKNRARKWADAAVKAAEHIAYEGAGTAEFCRQAP
jgi:acetyl/propionyl-CoA carboxylase alpha subunit